MKFSTEARDYRRSPVWCRGWNGMPASTRLMSPPSPLRIAREQRDPAKPAIS
jgi:hypothetical protein